MRDRRSRVPLGDRSELVPDDLPRRRLGALDPRRQRVRTNLWIGGGALVVALATGLSRTGDYSLVYAGELVGVALMFCGFTLGSVPKRRRAPALEPAAVAR